MKQHARLLALLLALLVTLTALPAYAATWQDLEITLRWSDDPNVQPVIAQPITWSPDQAFWAQVPYGTPFDQITLEFAWPDNRGWTYQPVDPVNRPWVFQDTGSEMQPSAVIEIAAYDANGAYQDQYLLYVSTSPMPQEPAQAQPAQITVVWQADDGTVFDRQTVEIQPGDSQTFYATDRDGYNPPAEQEITVWVGEDGNANRYEVVFTYTKKQEASFTIRYVDADTGADIAPTQTMTIADGTYQLNPSPSDLPANYEPAFSGSVTLTVSGGVADPQEVVFAYRYVAPATDTPEPTATEEPTPTPTEVPASATVTFRYVEEGTGADVASAQTMTVENGAYQVSPSPYDLPEGWVLVSDNTVILNVTNGIADPAEVVFTYRYVAPETATPEPTATPTEEPTEEPTEAPSSASVVFRYVEEGTGRDVASPQTMTVQNGRYQAGPMPNDLPEGWELVSDPVIVLTVENGIADPAELVFTYRYVAAETDTPEPTATEEPTATPTEEPTATPTLEPTAEPTDAPTSATVTFRYVEEGTDRDVASPQTMTVQNGRYQAGPMPNDLPEGWELVSDPTIILTVENGIADPAELVFSYRYAEQETATPEPTATPTLEPTDAPTDAPTDVPTSASVTFRYVEEGTDRDIATSQTMTVQNGRYQAAPMPNDLPEGWVLVSDASILLTVENGVADPAELVFSYRYVEAETATPEPTSTPSPAPTATEAPTDVPDSATVTFRYVDEATGAEIATMQTFSVKNGSYQANPMPTDLPANYELVSESSIVLRVVDGVATPPEVVFTYRYVAPATDTPTPSPTPTAEPPAHVDITVRYQNVAGRDLTAPVTVTLDRGTTNRIAPDARYVPDGYDIESAEPQTVTVSELGVPDKTEVIFTLKRTISAEETPIPVGATINRWAVTTGKGLNIREGTDRSYDSRRQISMTGSYVWVVREYTNDKGENWAEIVYDGTSGYVMSNYLNILSQAESDDYQDTLATPVPTTSPTPVPSPSPTPDPTATPTATPTTEPTATPTASPTGTIEPTATPTNTPDPTGTPTTAPTETPTTEPTSTPTTAPTASPTTEPTSSPTTEPTATPTASPTAVPEQYTGYALTRQATALRYEVSTADSSILQRLEENTLVQVSGQTWDSASNTWSRVTTLDNAEGFVPDSSLRRINAQEAKYYIDQWIEAHATATPTVTPTVQPTATPAPVTGYAYTIGDNVPLRTTYSDRSVILAWLNAKTAVYVTGQVYNTEDGWPWHQVQYQGSWGYIRSDMLRMMTLQEQDDYIASFSATDTPRSQVTPAPYSGQSLSSYGYVYAANGGAVNLRQSASQTSTSLRRLRQYAFCLVLGSQTIDGTTWYNVEYDGQRGWISGTYFHQMTIAELQDFLESDEYIQGIRNNSTATATATTGILTPEQQNVNTWTNPNSGINVNYATWSPIATVAPLATASPTVQPLVTEAATATPTTAPAATATWEPISTIDPIAPIDPDNGASGGGSSPVGWILTVVVVLLGGGAAAMFMVRNRKRETAQRLATQRAKAAQRSGNAASSTASGTPRTGTYPNQQRTAQPAYATSGAASGSVAASRVTSTAGTQTAGGTSSVFARPAVQTASAATAASTAATASSAPASTGRRTRRIQQDQATTSGNPQ